MSFLLFKIWEQNGCSYSWIKASEKSLNKIVVNYLMLSISISIENEFKPGSFGFRWQILSTAPGLPILSAAICVFNRELFDFGSTSYVSFWQLNRYHVFQLVRIFQTPFLFDISCAPLMHRINDCGCLLMTQQNLTLSHKMAWPDWQTVPGRSLYGKPESSWVFGEKRPDWCLDRIVSKCLPRGLYIT